MKLVLDLSDIAERDRPSAGGKAFALAKMVAGGLRVPKAVCISTHAYDRFLDATALRGRILMEYHRKPFEQMRWEEMWDASLRIQNMFLSVEMPVELRRMLTSAVGRVFRDRPVVVRSSAVGEDSAQASFAGLHESYVNVRGPDEVVEHIKMVWASLWSDAAMLYRKEIGLDVAQSKMAVLVQELVQGQKSGIVFGQDPNDATQAVIEAVYGLNEGLVDGTLEPDRWILGRRNGRIVSFTPARRDQAVVPAEMGTRMVSLPAARRRKPPLSGDEVAAVFQLEKQLESVFRSPQDVEWTSRKARLFVLQSRPITTKASDRDDDDRQWYLSLRPSLEDLRTLRRRIEDERLPDMIAAARELAGTDLAHMTEKKLAGEIRRRGRIYRKWKQIYWDEFIPFAHGFRLFGQVYNRMVRPDDPYEFTELLTSASLISVGRNRRLRELAEMVRDNPALRNALDAGRPCPHPEFETLFDAFLKDFEGPLLGDPSARGGLERLLVQMARPSGSRSERTPRHRKATERRFVHAFPPARREAARELLDLARASYRLRDDDNIYLGRLEAQLRRALAEATRRSPRLARTQPALDDADEIARALLDPRHAPRAAHRDRLRRPKEKIRPRQLLGQPAGQGVAVGAARVVTTHDDLFGFQQDEILVCDAIDPNMTFVVPMAAGIVERRGGMLIHGAIIAREYGLPCVTGIPDATTWIQTGDRVTVDGYLGIVTIGQRAG